jgi:hypothetical protein
MLGLSSPPDSEEPQKDGQPGLYATPGQGLYTPGLVFYRSPNGIRTRVATLRGWCPRPLDDGTMRRTPEGARRCSGGRTRTLNNWTRTSRVADYTTPEWVDDQVSRARRDRNALDSPWWQPLGVVEPLQVVETDDPAQPDTHGLLQEVRHGGPAFDRRGLGGRR